MDSGNTPPGKHSPGDGGKEPCGSRGDSSPAGTNRYRLRITYRKRGDSRFLSHLDFVRTLERALRRSELPIAFSEGFNPRIRLSFPGALSTGVESDVEQFDLWLNAVVDGPQVQDRLRDLLPAGIELLEACPAEGSFDSMHRVRYELRSGVGIPFSPAQWTALENAEKGELRGSMRVLQATTEQLLIAWKSYGGGTSQIRKLVAALEAVLPETAPLVVLKLPSQPTDLQLEWPTDDTEQLRRFLNGAPDRGTPVSTESRKPEPGAAEPRLGPPGSPTKSSQLRAGGIERSA